MATDQEQPVTLEIEAASEPISRRSSVRALRVQRARLEARWARVQASAAGQYWTRLTAADYVTSSTAFAALGVLCAFPFLATAAGVTGTDFRQAIIVRMGLNKQAAADVNALISPNAHAVATLTVINAVFVVAGAYGMAATLQLWYQKIYDLPLERSLVRKLVYQTAGIVGFCVYLGINVAILDALKPVGGVALMLAAQFVLSTLFWWISAYFIMFRRVPLRQLVPAGVATGACIAGLGVFSAIDFSHEITSGEKSYGPAGVVVALLTYVLAFGVCLHLGAVFGRMWNEWHAEGSRGEHGTRAAGQMTDHADEAARAAREKPKPA